MIGYFRCCCDSTAALLLSSVVPVKEVCDCGRVVPYWYRYILHCELRRMALTVEQMFNGVWCHSTLQTDIWYAACDAGLVTVQVPTVTRTQLGKCGMDWYRLLPPYCSVACLPVTMCTVALRVGLRRWNLHCHVPKTALSICFFWHLL